MPKSFLVKQRKICKQLKEEDFKRYSDEGTNTIQKFYVLTIPALNGFTTPIHLGS